MLSSAVKSNGFKPLTVEDKPTIINFLQKDPPSISELTFTNLFMWRGRYMPKWRVWNDCLLMIMESKVGEPYGLQPIGNGDLGEALDRVCQDLAGKTDNVELHRIDKSFVEKWVDPEKYHLVPDTDHDDYIYQTEKLINLSGRKYHRKKNHLNQFKKRYDFEYRELDIDMVECFLSLQEDWCRARNCAEDIDLFEEDRAIYDVLINFEDLDYKGGALLIDNKVQAFSLGEQLNPQTAVIHIEKANPEFQGIYTAINQQFCQEAWSDMEYINREQDLGLPGLRKAKMSYYPDHMVEKYTVTPK